ncbi:MAG: DinB family protein [Pyrinomonadaceae bacterium]
MRWQIREKLSKERPTTDSIGSRTKSRSCHTPEELPKAFDKNVSPAKNALAGASDKHLAGPWTLLASGQKVFSMPRVAMLRSFVLNHIIHYRAQLGAYLRLNDIPVPSIYGPSADEQM